MAENSNNTKTAAAKKDRIGYEVLSTIMLGRQSGQEKKREAGETLYDDEVDGETLQFLLTTGKLADRNKPVPPSQAEGVFAFDHLVDVAKALGVVKYKDGKYSLAGSDAEHTGLMAFRSAVSIDQLKAAIVAKAK
jgi:hypothetical protein